MVLSEAGREPGWMIRKKRRRLAFQLFWNFILHPISSDESVVSQGLTWRFHLMPLWQLPVFLIPPPSCMLAHALVEEITWMMDCRSCSLILSISFSLSRSKICSLFGRFSMSFFSLRLCRRSILHSSSSLLSRCFSWSICGEPPESQLTKSVHIEADCPAMAAGRPVPPAAGPCSSSQPCSSPRSARRTSWPVCSFRPSQSAARRCRCFSLLSAYCILQNILELRVFEREHSPTQQVQKNSLRCSHS